MTHPTQYLMRVIKKSQGVVDKLLIILFFRGYSEEDVLELLKESKVCGQVVLRGRERYQKNTFGHGLFLLKLSEVEKRLRNFKTSGIMQTQATEILRIAIGKDQTEAIKQKINSL